MTRTLLMMTVAWTLSSPARAGEMCDAALAAVSGKGPALMCAEAPRGVALAPDVDRAATLALHAEAGEGRFKTHFGREATRYAVIEIMDEAVLSGQLEALKAAGFLVRFPNLSPAEYSKRLADGIRSSVVAQARAAGVDEKVMLAQVGPVIANGTSVLGLNNRDATTVPHELGHGWFTRAYWPREDTPDVRRYGGPGTDWMDETSAVLMEGGDSAEQRRSQFRTIYRGEGRASLTNYSVDRLTDLRLFLTREHPKIADLRLTAEKAAQEGRTPSIVTTSFSAGGTSDPDGIVFYLQSRMFADYLIDRTGDPGIFGSIGEAFGRGETMDDWLTRTGSTKNLASSIDALTADWRGWLTARFGAPRA